MIYNIGNILVCKKKLNSTCLGMTNHNYNIMLGDKFVVTDTDDWPENAECHWYEMVSLNEDIVLNAWNDKDHLVIDENFDKLKPSAVSKEDFSRAAEIMQKTMQIENNF